MIKRRSAIWFHPMTASLFILHQIPIILVWENVLSPIPFSSTDAERCCVSGMRCFDVHPDITVFYKCSVKKK